MLQLDSTQNPKVRQLIRYREKSALRRKDGVVLVEGVRELERAVAAGWTLRQTFWEPATAHVPAWAQGHGQHFRCASAVYEKLVLRENGAGAVGLLAQPVASLDNLVLPAKPWILVLDGLEKPGNVGAILRTADAVGVDAVVFSSLECDPYSPQAVRNSTDASPNLLGARHGTCSGMGSGSWTALSLRLGGLRKTRFARKRRGCRGIARPARGEPRQPCSARQAVDSSARRPRKAR